MFCQWEFTGPQDSAILVEFNAFDLANTVDYVYVGSTNGKSLYILGRTNTSACLVIDIILINKWIVILLLKTEWVESRKRYVTSFISFKYIVLYQY